MPAVPRAFEKDTREDEKGNPLTGGPILQILNGVRQDTLCGETHRAEESRGKENKGCFSSMTSR